MILIFAIIKFYIKFDYLGPPSIDFEPIVPKGSSIYSYYDIPNPKIRHEPAMLEISNKDDPYLSHFSFVDIN
jgi:hypothetical protein